MDEEAKNSKVLPESKTLNSFYLLSRCLKAVYVCLLILILASIIILICVPPVSRDALTHHLAVPKLYLKHGGIYEIPSIVFSYYPMNLDLLYLIPLYFENDIAPKYIHFLFALLTAGLIFCYLRKRLNSQWGLFGALFFLSLPHIVKLSIAVYVDLGLVFFSTASLFALLKWIESQFKLRFLILSALCCGLALGIKYNGLIVLFLLTLFIPFIFISNSKKDFNTKDSAEKSRRIKVQIKALGFGAIFFCIALMVFSPWMLRNYVWKANPVYPLYNNFFNRPVPLSPETPSGSQNLGTTVNQHNTSETKSTRWSPFAIRKVIFGESWWEIALIPVRIFFQGQDDNPKYFDGQLNPFLFFLPFFAFIHMRKDQALLRTEKKILIFFAILFLLYAISTTSIRIRYIAPIIPPLAILATFGLHQITRMVTKQKNAQPAWFGLGFIICIVTIIMALNTSYVLKQFRYVDPFSYLSGRVSRATYISKYRPEYSIYKYVNQHLPDNAKILGLFLGNRRYYCDRELIFDVDDFEENVNRSDSEEILIKNLKEKGFTHLVVRFDLFNQWANRQFDKRRKELLNIFFAEYVKPVLSKDGHGLFELRSPHLSRLEMQDLSF